MHRPVPAHDDTSWWQRHQARLTPPLLLAPGVFLFLLFVVYPIAENIRLSFYDWDGVGQKIFVGWRNYRELFADPVFHTALRNNFLWLALFMLAPVSGLLLALVLNQEIFGIRLIRALFFMPFVVSQVVVGLVFAWFFSSRFGLFDHLLGLVGVPPAELLDGERSAILAVIFAAFWPQTAYCMIFYLTGLAALRLDLVEAARLQGARGLSLLWSVVLPQLRPVTFIVILVCIVSALRSFDLVMIMTQGGPYDSSTVLAYYMYEQTFLSGRYGYAATVATVLFVIMSAGVGLALWRLLRRELA
jgi:multiple sugar transport system permease protein